jgi:hypothetical protein
VGDGGGYSLNTAVMAGLDPAIYGATRGFLGLNVIR